MTIGEVAKRTGVSVQAIRLYERRGLIRAPGRRASGYRVYAPDVIREVRLIRWAQGLGFKLGEMGELMRLARRRHSAPSRAVSRQAETKVREIDETIRRLQARRRSLELIVHCACREDCPLVDQAIGKRGES